MSHAGIVRAVRLFFLALHIFAGLAGSIGDAKLQMPHSGRGMLLEPSVLAADIGNLASEARRLEAAGFTWVHVDVCDGSRECCRALSSLGPASIAAIRKAAPTLSIDVHLYVREPEHHGQSIHDILLWCRLRPYHRRAWHLG